MQTLTWHAYDDCSLSFFNTYESLSFSKLHRSILKLLPEKGAECLDVGAGSGRDAAALARRGYNVTAVEPSLGLLELAKEHHHHPRIRWIQDSLPQLESLITQEHQYDFILLSAVWMHIASEDRPKALSTLARLLKPKGRLALTIRLGQPSSDRLMYPVDLDEILLISKKFNLWPIYVSRSTSDSLKRESVKWKKVVLEKREYDASNQRTNTLGGLGSI